MTPAAIIAAARSYLGVPWVHMGRSRLGLDCVGLLLVAMRDAGGPVYEPAPYSRVVNPAALSRELEHFCDLLPVGAEIAPGDVLRFRIAGSPQHVGLVTATTPDLVMIHTYQSAKHVAEHPVSEKWRRRLCGVYRFREAG